MNFYSQLTRLIFDFYREDPAELAQLQGLKTSRLSRWWGVFRINCRDAQTATDIIDAIDLIRHPIDQLRLAHDIRVLVKGKAIATFPVTVVQLDHETYGRQQL
ncbi:MAG: hypothetical protein WBA57_22200 [Elainellaceae cyanobacterium]